MLPRKHSRFAAALGAAISTLLLLTHAAPVAAKGACRGTDMLAELAKSDPATHERVMAEAKSVSNTEALLWKVEKAGLPTSHLLGTVHLTDERVTKLPKAVETALASSKTMALEVADLSAAAMAGAMGKVENLVLFGDGRRLDTLLDKAEFATLQSAVGKMGLPGEVSALFRPWVVYMMLAVPDCEQRKVQDGHLVLDMKLAAAAKSRGLPVVGLETIEGQLAAMAAVPEDQQLQMLRATLKYADRRQDSMETVLQLYLNRNMGAAWPFQMALAAKAGVDPRMFDGFMRELIVKRNKGMADAALPLLDKGAVFIGVGALHLPGKTGLVQLLRDAGYTVTAVE